MTDKQAARIEKLLRFHSIQLQNIYTQMIASMMLVAPDDVFGQPDFKQSNMRQLEASKKMVGEVMEALNAEIRSESKERGAEMDRLTKELMKDMLKPPIGFRPDSDK